MSDPAHPLLETVSHLPLRPGVYRFLDERQRVLYVGKAKSLKKRVTSYFRGGGSDPSLLGATPRIRLMLDRAKRIEVTITVTESEALILEANLIKRFRPPYNVLLKDDKSHPYLHLTTDHSFPRLALYRGGRSEKGRYFGPYPSVHAVRDTLRWLQKVFPIRQCEDTQFNNRQRPCLQYQIKRCGGPCCGRISREAYGELVRELTLFLQGRERFLSDSLKKSMWRAAEARDFEEAARLRDRIRAMALIQDQRRVNLSSNQSLDVICVAGEEPGGEGTDPFAVQVFHIRDGINLGNRNFFPENTDGLDAGEMLESFLALYYTSMAETGAGTDELSDPGPPAEILVNLSIPDVGWLEGALGEMRGGRVRIHQPRRGEKRRLLEMARLNAEQALVHRARGRGSHGALLRALAEVLDLDHVPERIECYDISHFKDSEPVGSLVVFGPGGWQKNGYRRFAIKDLDLADDTARMAEVLLRRFSGLKKNEPVDGADRSESEGGGGETGVWPDLVLLDGGRGQLNVALELAAELQLDGVRFCAIAKGPDRNAGRERLFLPGREEPVVLPERSPVLFLLQNIRDEAHRFAIGYHRLRRQRKQTGSILDRVPGIGGMKKRLLLRHFGSVKAIRGATAEELTVVPGISAGLAERIVTFIREET